MVVEILFLLLIPNLKNKINKCYFMSLYLDFLKKKISYYYTFNWIFVF